MNKKTSVLLPTLFSLAFSISSMAFATADHAAATSNTTAPHHIVDDSEYKPHVGAQLGIANPEGSYDTGMEYTLDVGMQPYVPFGLGLEFGHTNATSRSSEENLSRNLLMAKGTYNFSGENSFIKYSYLGLGFGRSFGTGGDLWVTAPLAGFDFPIASLFQDRKSAISVGAIAKYLIYEGTNADSLSVDAMVKYWF